MRSLLNFCVISGAAYAAVLFLALFGHGGVRASAVEMRIVSDYCDIYYTEATIQRAADAALAADEIWPVLAAAFGIDANGCRPSVTLREDAAALSKAVGADKAARGAYRGGVIYVLTDLDALTHELAHLAVDVKTGGRAPRWLTEGVALYYERKLTGEIWREDLAGVSVPIADLKQNFDQIDTGAAYRGAYEEVERRVQTGGEGGLQTILYHLGQGADLEKIWD